MKTANQTLFMAVALVAAAVGGGVISSALAGRSSTPLPAAERASSDPEAEAPRSAATRRASGRDLAMLQKVGELESRVTELEEAEPVEVDPGVPDDPTAARTPEEYLEDHAQALEEHRAEPIDQAWSTVTTRSVQSDIEQLGEEIGFGVGRVECRNETCSAETSWEHFSEAKDNYMRILTSPFRANCARRIIFPERGPDEPVSGTLLLDCSDWKQQGSVPLTLDRG